MIDKELLLSTDSQTHKYGKDICMFLIVHLLNKKYFFGKRLKAVAPTTLLQVTIKVQVEDQMQPNC